MTTTCATERLDDDGVIVDQEHARRGHGAVECRRCSIAIRSRVGRGLRDPTQVGVAPASTPVLTAGWFSVIIAVEEKTAPAWNGSAPGNEPEEEAKLVKALQRQTGVEAWEPKRTPVHRRVIEAFPRELAIRHRVFPVAMRRNNIGVSWFVATTDPTDEALRNQIGNVLCTPDEPVVLTWFVATASAIDAAIEEHYSEDAAPQEPEILIEEAIEEPVKVARISIAKVRSPSTEGD